MIGLQIVSLYGTREILLLVIFEKVQIIKVRNEQFRFKL